METSGLTPQQCKVEGQWNHVYGGEVVMSFLYVYLTAFLE